MKGMVGLEFHSLSFSFGLEFYFLSVEEEVQFFFVEKTFYFFDMEAYETSFVRCLNRSRLQVNENCDRLLLSNKSRQGNWSGRYVDYRNWILYVG